MVDLDYMLIEPKIWALGKSRYLLEVGAVGSGEGAIGAALGECEAEGLEWLVIKFVYNRR